VELERHVLEQPGSGLGVVLGQLGLAAG
jgi:hypothetical protein